MLKAILILIHQSICKILPNGQIHTDQILDLSLNKTVQYKKKYPVFVCFFILHIALNYIFQIMDTKIVCSLIFVAFCCFPSVSKVLIVTLFT